MREQVPSRGGRTGISLRGVIVALVATALAVPSAPAAAESHVETFVAFDLPPGSSRKGSPSASAAAPTPAVLKLPVGEPGQPKP
jgi:hypothetical protein